MSFQDDQVFLEKYLDEHLNTVLGLRLAETYISTDNLEGAHQTLTEFLESHPDNATAMFLLGEIAFKEGDNEKAQNLYEETIQTDPSYTAAYHRLVTISADGGDQTTVKEIYALLNRLNPLDTRAAAEVGDKDSATSLNSEFSKKVLNQITLTIAEPEEESEIEQDAEPIEPTTVEDNEENKISSETFTEPENIPLGGEEVKTEIEVEESTDEEGSFDLDSAGETKEPEVTESDESDEELSESEEPTESESEEPEEDNPFGVGGADDSDKEETEEEAVVQETDPDTEETSEEAASETSEQEDDPFASEEVVEETTQDEESAEEQTEDESSEESEDEADEVKQAEEESEESKDDETSEAEDKDPFASEEVAEETTEDEESAEEQTEDESSEEPEDEADESTEEQTEDEGSEEPEDEADKVEQTEEPEEDETTETQDEEESTGETSDQKEDPSATEDETADESTDIADSIVDKESRGFELPPFSKETLADIKIDDQNESYESKSEEGNSNMNQDEGADGLNIPLDSSDDSDNTDNIETATENMIDESGAEEHNIPIDGKTTTEDAGSDTPSDYESWVDKDVTPGSMTSGGDENDNNISKNTFEGLLSEPDVAVETLESEDPEEEESEGTIKEEIEDFQKKVDNIYNLDEEEEVSPLQAWFLEKNSSTAEEVAEKEEIKTENIDPPLTEPMSVPFSEENSQDESDSADSEDNGKAWDDFVETTSESKKSSVKADSAVSEESESVVTEVDRDLQNIFDDVVTTESDETDQKEDDTEDSKSASIGGVKLSNDLATFTLAEIYSNQGQYSEALSVLDLLEKKEKDIDKIKSMREEIKKKIEARNK